MFASMRERQRNVVEALVPALIRSESVHSRAVDIGSPISPPLSFNFEAKSVGELSIPTKRSCTFSIDPMSVCLTLDELDRVRSLLDALPKGAPGDTAGHDEVNREGATESKLTVDVGGMVVSLIDNDAPIFRGAIKRSSLFLSERKEIQEQLVRGSFTISPEFEYHCSRSWHWEPFLEPCLVSTSFSLLKTNNDHRELSMEVCDEGEALCLNISDAFVAKISKVFERSRRSRVEFDNIMGFAQVAELLHSSSEKSSERHFLFRNKCGVQAYFSRELAQTTTHTTPRSLLTEFSEASMDTFAEVPNGTDFSFLMKAPSHHSNKGFGNYFAESPEELPKLFVSLESEHGHRVQKLQRLDMIRPCERLLSLQHKTPHVKQRDWITWCVEQVDETTNLTLGTAVKVLSLLERSFELGVRKMRSSSQIVPIGKVELGNSLDLPVWIGMENSCWIVFLRLSQDDPFTPLFVVQVDGSIDMSSCTEGCIVCDTAADRQTSVTLSVTKGEDHGITTVYIDATASLRNMLPADIDWEIRDEMLGETVDGSTIRQGSLSSGGFVDVLCSTSKISFRVRPCMSGLRWSSWQSFGKSDTEEEQRPDSEEIIEVLDIVNARLPFGYRVSKRRNGFDVFVYAEMWCSNGTALNLVFGSSAPSHSENHVRGSDFSAAEATLKEMTSLFESGEGGTGLTRKLNVPKERPDYVTRLPGQVVGCVTEEIYEYMEFQRSTVTRQWWASEDPFDPRPDIDSLGTAWEWVDTEWVC